MEDITLEDLRQYQDILEELEAIRDEIRMIYIESPSPKEVIGGRSSVSTPGDPTARKAMKALERKERLENRERQLEDLQERIEKYIDRMTDHHTAAIMGRLQHKLLRQSIKINLVKTFPRTTKYRHYVFTANSVRSKLFCLILIHHFAVGRIPVIYF